jgi:hypothetical protein
MPSWLLGLALAVGGKSLRRWKRKQGGLCGGAEGCPNDPIDAEARAFILSGGAHFGTDMQRPASKEVAYPTGEKNGVVGKHVTSG